MTVSSGLSETLSTQEVIQRIFREPETEHGLSEFADLRKKPHQILSIFHKRVPSGPAAGEVRYYLKCFKRQADIQVLAERKANPEEIVRQLWLYRLQTVYNYPLDHIAVEHPVSFGSTLADKPADIVVFQQDGRTAKIIIEVKRPNRKDGINQLKSYLNAEGSPVGAWSNGHDRVILYRPYPREFDDTLTDLPNYSQSPKDVLAAKLTLSALQSTFDFKSIIQTLEELILANAGVDEFNEIFKIIFAKLYDEKAARDRKNREVAFRKSEDPLTTYETVDKLFRKAIEEWPGIFDDNEHIKLTPAHLQVVVGPLVRIRLLGSNMRVMDDAFEYLMPAVAKKKNGQFFTPRYVIDMCVKMLNPTSKEYVVDPACGSAGFLVHAMEHVWPATEETKLEERKHKYANRYLWGMDFDERSAKVARALMLIAGDGRSHVFRVNSLDPREWFTSQEGDGLRNALREANFLVKKPLANKVIKESEAWEYYRQLKFDVLLTNPPFAGEIRDKDLLRRYALAEKAAKKENAKVERDVLFLERCFDLLVPGGRLAIILPQGKVNNATLAHIRNWVLARARLLAVVGLHPNTFKPHTGTKTSVVFAQKYTEMDLAALNASRAAVLARCPDFVRQLSEVLAKSDGREVAEEDLSPEVLTFLHEWFEADEDQDELVEAADESEGEGGAAGMEAARRRWEDTVGILRKALADAQEQKDKASQAALRGQLRNAERELTKANLQAKLQSLRGRIELVLADTAAQEELRRRWVESEVARRQDYAVFMATSELGGKDSSGEYIYRVDESGAVLEDPKGNPLIAQDCVKYRDEDPDTIAEHFVRWARREKLSFWRGE